MELIAEIIGAILEAICFSDFRFSDKDNKD